MKQEMESIDNCHVKKISLDSKKRKGHEKQYVFNEQVKDKIDAAASALQQTPPVVEKACAVLEEGEKLINLPQKNILIADRSQHGWATVAEYEEDELVDNSDDEKHLFRAEMRVGRKMKQKSARDKKGDAPRKPFKSSWSSSAPWSGEHMQSSSAAAAFTPGMQLFVPLLFNQGSAMVRRPIMPTAPRDASQLGPHFLCEKIGHYRKACPCCRILRLLRPLSIAAVKLD